jgi:cob(I)alamin adenosyltransferase
MSTQDRDPERHARKMAKKARAREKIMATKDIEKGLIIVNTGKGKGKSTAAFGMVLRALGHGMKVAVIQFIKGSRDIGEKKALEAFGDQVSFFACGEGFTWETQNLEKDRALARRTWAEAEKALMPGSDVDLVVLDELNVVLKYGYLTLDEVMPALLARPGMQHVVITGRNAPEELIEQADLVTEMTLIKHPFRAGVKAQKGVEF